jgi:hypothetical protein
MSKKAKEETEKGTAKKVEKPFTPEEKEKMKIAVLAVAVAGHIPFREARQMSVISRNWVRNPGSFDERTIQDVKNIASYLVQHVEKYIGLADKVTSQ